MGTLFRDLRYSLRTLRKAPGFSAVVILTLALGIGANTAIFSIVDGVLLRPLPFPAPQQLVRIVDNLPGAAQYDIGMSVPELRDLQASGIFADVSAAWPVDCNLTGSGQPERAELLVGDTNYFTMLGVHPQLGRVFGPQDKADGFAEAALISDAFWRRSFGADPGVLGHRIRLDGDAYTIVGVLPPDFRHPGPTLSGDVDVWGTAGFSANPFPKPPQRNQPFIPGAIGRLRPGLSVEQAQARLDSFTAQLRAQYPNDYRPAARFSIQLQPLKDSLTGNVRAMLLILLGAVAMMLLIGCVNIANLLLVRGAGRMREFALRQSLGATRARLLRELLTESVLLAIAAGVVGVAAAAASLRLLLYLVPSKLPRLSEIAIDSRVLLFSIAVSLLTGVLFGLLPALQVSGRELANRLKEGARGVGGSRGQNRASSILVTAEFAICLMLMTGAGLLVRSFWKLAETDPGFNPQKAMVARLWLAVPNDPTQDIYAKLSDRTRFEREVLRRVSALPAVTAAAISTSIPLSPSAPPRPVTIEGRPLAAGDATLAQLIGASPDYFRTLETPLVDGRYFNDSDQGAQPPRGQTQPAGEPAPSLPVAVVDRAAAAHFWPGQSPLGKRFKLGRAQSTAPWITVVGLVGDVHQESIDTAGVAHVYLPLYQFSSRVLGVMVRTAADPAVIAESLRREIQAVDPNLPVFGVQSFSHMLSASLTPHRFSAQLMATFAALALLLAAIGIYGVLAYFVGQRTREIGIRMALGAEASSVVRLVLWEGLRPIGLGIALGLAGSLALGRVLAQLVYGVSTSDPLVLAAVPVFLTIAALLASYLPARRATRIDPLIALRCE